MPNSRKGVRTSKWTNREKVDKIERWRNIPAGELVIHLSRGCCWMQSRKLIDGEVL
jgi:hypothetical protein